MNLSLYLDDDTWIHSLDGRTKILCLLGLFTLTLIFSDPMYLLFLSTGIIGLVLWARSFINVKKIWILLALLILTGCDDEIIKEGKKPKTVSETESIETEPPLPDKITWDKDGSKMVLIPAGRFKMGDSKNEPEPRMRDARPVHRVELDAFYFGIVRNLHLSCGCETVSIYCFTVSPS